MTAACEGVVRRLFIFNERVLKKSKKSVTKKEKTLELSDIFKTIESNNNVVVGELKKKIQAIIIFFNNEKFLNILKTP